MGKITVKTKKGISIVAIVIFVFLMAIVYKKSLDHHIKVSIDDNNVDLLLKIDDLDLNQPSKDGTIEGESTSSQDIEVLETNVYIYGQVKTPGKYNVETSKTLEDVIQMAGGILPSADLSKINIEKQIVVNETICIPNIDQDMIFNDKQNCYYSVNELNELDKVSLDELDGIGEVMAERIIKYREVNGPFTQLDELKNIKGIGDKKYTMILNKQ